MALDVARKNNVRYDADVKVNLRNTSRRKMDMRGVATLVSRPKYFNGVFNRNKKRVKSTCIITGDMTNKVLICREDLKKFGVIQIASLLCVMLYQEQQRVKLRRKQDDDNTRFQLPEGAGADRGTCEKCCDSGGRQAFTLVRSGSFCGEENYLQD